METILVIDDDPEVHELLRRTFGDTYRSLFVFTTAEGRRVLEVEQIDLVILDVSLPDMDGLTFLMDLQSEGVCADLPVIFLTARDRSSDKVAGLSLGVDDYVTKPFDRVELKARVALRLAKSRQRRNTERFLHKNGLQFDISRQQLAIVVNGERRKVDLTALEFRLILHLARHEDHVLTRRSLLDNVWGTGMHVVDRTIDAHVSNLRRKLKGSNYGIESVYGEGYRFIELKRRSDKKGA